MWGIYKYFAVYGFIFLFECSRILHFGCYSYGFPCYLIYPFFVFLATVVCNPLYLTFNLSLTISLALDFAPVSFCCVVRSDFVKSRGIWIF